MLNNNEFQLCAARNDDSTSLLIHRCLAVFEVAKPSDIGQLPAVYEAAGSKLLLCLIPTGLKSARVYWTWFPDASISYQLRVVLVHALLSLIWFGLCSLKLTMCC